MPRDRQRYRIIGEHGRGGIGRVSRAHDEDLGRDVAIKELISRGQLNEVRFLREALITARLEHPGIVPVHEAGRWPDGTPFYAMKLVAGRPLRELIAERATVEERIGLLHHVIAVADAIAYAHGRNIIHRDLKPGNVIVGDFGETIVIDWGLAKDLTVTEEMAAHGGPFRSRRDDDLTAAGCVLGTPSYMAPEQKRGEPVDQRADVFAIGVMLWELCAALRTPPADAAQRRRMLQRAGIDPDLIAIIDKAVDLDPARRYLEAGALAADLKAFKSGARIAARSYSLLDMFAHWTRRHRPLAMSVIAAIAISITGGAFYIQTIANERDRADAALERVEITNKNLATERAVAIEQRNTLILAQATAALDTDPTRTLEWLKTYPTDGAEWNRVQVIAADALSRGVARHVLPTMSATISISPDGKTLLTAGPHDLVQLWDLEHGTRVHALSFGGPVTAARIAPDGATIAIGGRNGDVVLWNPVSDSRTVLGKLDGGTLYAAFSPDGLSLASSSLHSVVVWDLTTLHRRWSTSSPHPVTALAMSPVGSTLAFGTSDGRLQLRNVAHGRGSEFRGHVGAINAIAFSSDGTRIATGGRDHSVRWWNSATGAGQILGSHDGLVRELRFSPVDPTLIASAGADHTVRLWNLNGNRHRVFTGHTDVVNGLMFSPDGRLLGSVSPDRHVRLWDVGTGDSRVLRGHRGDLGDVLFSPDGALLVSSGFDEGTRVWSLAPPVDRVLGRHEFEAVHATFSPNSDVIASAGSDKIARLWHLPSGTEQALAGSEYSGLAFATGVVFSTTGEMLVSVGDNAARLWHLPRGEVRTFVAPETLLRKVTISSDGNLLAAGGSDGSVRVWDITLNRLTVITRHRGEVAALLFLPVGTQLVSGATDGSLRVSDVSSAKSEVLGAHSAAITQLAATLDGHLVASASRDGSIRLWDVATHESRVLTGHSDGVSGLAFSGDGHLLVSSCMDKTARVWDVASGESRVLRGHDEALRAIALANDSKTLATVGNDQTLRLWSLESGAMAILRGHHGVVRSVAFDSSGERLVTASEDATVRLWDLSRVVPVPRGRNELVHWLHLQTTADLPQRGSRDLEPAPH